MLRKEIKHADEPQNIPVGNETGRLAAPYRRLFAPLLAKADNPKPNVVYLLADDLGWSDISEHRGGTILTPHIDHLFSQGVELRNFMGWCVCSPTRAMLMTGRHPFRVGTGPETGGELAQGESTLAEGFKAIGYRTGIFGKWHNGDDPDTPEYRRAWEEAFKSLPNKKLVGGLGVDAHGFVEAWIYYGGGADYFTRRTVGGKGPVSWWHNREYRQDDKGYCQWRRAGIANGQHSKPFPWHRARIVAAKPGVGPSGIPGHPLRISSR